MPTKEGEMGTGNQSERHVDFKLLTVESELCGEKIKELKAITKLGNRKAMSFSTSFSGDEGNEGREKWIIE